MASSTLLTEEAFHLSSQISLNPELESTNGWELDPSFSDHNNHSGSESGSRKSIEVQSPAYLKSEEYRLLFRLPPDEILVQDFNCAFQESILLQGHMYLFVRHICFYSNIFGFETKKTIPFNEVTCVRKAKTAGIFPNAIEIVAGGKKNFFASFLSRDEAYRLIVDGWSQYLNGTEVLIDHQDFKSEILSGSSVRVIHEKPVGSEQQTNELNPFDRNKDGDLSGDCKLLSNGEDDISVPSSPLEAEENGEGDAEPIDNAEHLSSGKPLVWTMEDVSAPEVPDYFTKVAESKFQVQVEDFFNLFFSDKAVTFVDTFHRICGDKGAKFGHCREVQRFRVYRNSHLVIETSQEIGDVPYADYFLVEGRWVVQKDVIETNKCCILRVYVNVAFSKKTIWKGKIEQSTIEECREAYSAWLDNAHEFLKQNSLEKIDGETSAPNIIPIDAQFEECERVMSPLQRLPVTSDVLQILSVASDTKHVNPAFENSLHGGLSAASFSASFFRESFMRFSMYLKSHNHIPLLLVIASVLILLMQLSIIVLLTRSPQVHLISHMDHMNGIGTSRNDMAEAGAWLEKRVHYLKDEMHMVEARLERMQHEHSMLKEHFKGLEQLRKSRQ
ncbi:hypothetical protein IFM89_005574 [Coptis chinensis]|uniref:VASt domain-containing protein n=1 Tax=Coptis chinensis TaxID=261450 RepID=A0A835I7P5_9MAGN|nr:hypothetical protein IFM89_005574 [Coptis chinensis]